MTTATVETGTMNALKPFTYCVISARRWFNRNEGNTYHSCVVHVDGVEVGRVDCEYGYGDCFNQTAHEILQRAGYYAKTDRMSKGGANVDYSEFRQDQMNFRTKFVVNVSDVKRKKDL